MNEINENMRLKYKGIWIASFIKANWNRNILSFIIFDMDPCSPIFRIIDFRNYLINRNGKKSIY
jgi:hypothetical protein